jgi:hypothetical protein
MARLGLDEDIVSLAALIAGAVIGGYALTALYAYTTQTR